MRLPRKGRSPLFPRARSSSKNIDRDKLSFSFVIIFFVLFGLLVVAEVFFIDTGRQGYQTVRGRSELFYEDDPSTPWETPKPLPGTRGDLEETEVNLNKDVGSIDSSKFKEKVRVRQAEMEELIRNISEGMKRNPIMKQIQAGRQKVKEEEGFKVDVDTSLERHKGRDAEWQLVNGTSHKFYVYSAFYDDRARPIVRVIAATKTKHSDKVWCALYYRGSEPVLVPAGINVIRENWNLKYSAAFLTCDLFNKTNKQFLDPPHSLSIVAKYRLPASNQLPVHFTKTGLKNPVSSNIGVCVKPLHFHYNKTLELVEFIELNLLLGVSKFTLYNDTVGSEVNCLLQDYMKQGVLEVKQWRLNMDSQKEIRTEGLFAALNDCLYRNMNSFKYLMLIDFDEFIIPHQNNTLIDMILSIDSQPMTKAGEKVNPLPTSSYSFQNSFFYLQWPNDPNVRASPELTTLLKTRRKLKFNPQRQRSKYICIPHHVKEVGNHFVWEFHRGRTLNVPTQVGFVHHYRVCEFGGDDCLKSGFVSDSRVPDTWGPQLQININASLNRTTCDIPKLKQSKSS